MKKGKIYKRKLDKIYEHRRKYELPRLTMEEIEAQQELGRKSVLETFRGL